jgi:hypothetical protein
LIKQRHQVGGHKRDHSSGHDLMLAPQNLLSGASTSSSKFVNTPLRSRVSRGHAIASTPLVIDPPDTEEIVLILESTPTSFKRLSEPM